MYKLIQDDCLNVMKMMPDGSVDLIVTDPPYEIAISGGGLFRQPDKQYVKELANIKDGFSDEILDEMCRIMKKINIYLFCSQKQIMPLLQYWVNKKGCNWNILSWHKTNPVPACGNKYLTDTEFILFFRQKGVRLYGSFDTKRTWYATPLNQAEKKKYKHPTVKPIRILSNLIENSSIPGDMVFDPFMGSGSTGVACINTGRNFIGIELDENYFEIAKNRIESSEKQNGEKQL